MFVLTDSDIAAQSGNLDAGHVPADEQKLLRGVFRQYAVSRALIFPVPVDAAYSTSTAERVAAAEDFDAQVLLAALAKIRALGEKLNTVTIENLTTRRKEDERMGWAEVAVLTLFDESELLPAAGQVVVGRITWPTTESDEFAG